MFPQYMSEIMAVYVVILFLITILLDMTFTNICLSVYIGGVLLFAMMGIPGRERVASSFAFTLPLAYLLFIIEDHRKTVAFSPPMRMRLTAAFNIFVFLFLYTANFLPFVESNFHLEKQTLIKLSDDPQMNRSLYYNQEGALFYTLYDNEKIGYKRPYEKIICTQGPCIIE